MAHWRTADAHRPQLRRGASSRRCRILRHVACRWVDIGYPSKCAAVRTGQSLSGNPVVKEERSCDSARQIRSTTPVSAQRCCPPCRPILPCACRRSARNQRWRAACARVFPSRFGLFASWRSRSGRSPDLTSIPRVSFPTSTNKRGSHPRTGECRTHRHPSGSTVYMALPRSRCYRLQPRWELLRQTKRWSAAEALQCMRHSRIMRLISRFLKQRVGYPCRQGESQKVSPLTQVMHEAYKTRIKILSNRLSCASIQSLPRSPTETLKCLTLPQAQYFTKLARKRSGCTRTLAAS